MEKSVKKSESVSIISSSDGPTSVFLLGGHKPNMKQKIQKKVFELRKKWYALCIKPGTHTMEEVVGYMEVPEELFSLNYYYLEKRKMMILCIYN